MLKMSLFMITITVSRRKMTAKEYEHKERVKMLRQDLEEKRLRHYSW